MSRRPAKHCPNKAKLNVSKRHQQQCNKMLSAFMQFINNPWSADPTTHAQLQSASNGPVSCDPVSLLINGQNAILSIFLAAFIVTFRMSDAALKKKYGDKYKSVFGQVFDMRNCDIRDLFLAAGTYKGYVASLNAGINRAVFNAASEWKKQNMNGIMNGSIHVPEWVNNPPQIDIESDGQWSDVQAAFKSVHNKCHKKRGSFSPSVLLLVFAKNNANKYCLHRTCNIECK